MAIRPFYKVVDSDISIIEQKDIEFEWIKGMAISQKQKCIDSFHKSIKDYYPDSKILEISTKSRNDLGVKLSAFNLTKYSIKKNKEYSVECLFQGSKVFEKGGPFVEIYNMTSREAKKYFQDKELGNLLYFQFGKEKWELVPTTMFYDWLYLTTLHEKKDLVSELIKYDIFTDIEFNPKKSYNNQAKSVALYVALYKKNMLKILESIEEYKKNLDLLYGKEKNIVKKQVGQLSILKVQER